MQAIVVAANGGNVDEHGVVVGASLAPIAATNQPAPPLRTLVVSRRIALFAAGSSLDLTLPNFAVQHGTLYLLTVTIEIPGGPPGTKTSESVRVQIAAG